MMQPTIQRKLVIGLVVTVAFYMTCNKTFAQTSQETNAGKITSSNWTRHPQIVEIRALVAEVDGRINNGSLKVSKRLFDYCEPYVDTSRRFAIDEKGIVRFYENEGGSEDSSLKFLHYYGPDGVLRFVFITGGAVNGAQMQHRIYFDKTGKRIWEIQKYVKLPRYTFPEVWPDDQLQVSDPAKAFAADSPCPETKPKAK